MSLRIGSLALITAFFAGCSGAPTSGPERMSNAILLGEESIDDSRVILNVVGPLDIDIQSSGGNVEIEEDPDLDATIIEPVRRSTHGHLRREFGENALDALDYRIQLERGDLDRETLKIRAWSDHAEEHFQGVDFRIRTPQLGSIRVKTEQGRVWVRNNQGPVDIETSYGDIRVVTNYAMTGQITLITKDATIDYRAGRGSTGLFDLVSKGGEVYQRFTEARVHRTSPTNGPSQFVGLVGDGDNTVTLRTTFDDIRVAIVDHPTENGTWILEP